MKNILLLTLLLVILAGCGASRKSSSTTNRPNVAIKSQVKLKGKVPARTIKTGNVSASEVVTFAETLIGVPYRYGSIDKKKGLDCSGFMYYVFNHFKISVPRVSRDYTNAGKEVSTLEARRGDIILFTGSNPKSGEVGHMGFITENRKGVLKFIHSASGNNRGVMISGMDSYFIPRFVKVIRVFNQR